MVVTGADGTIVTEFRVAVACPLPAAGVAFSVCPAALLPGELTLAAGRMTLDPEVYDALTTPLGT